MMVGIQNDEVRVITWHVLSCRKFPSSAYQEGHVVGTGEIMDTLYWSTVREAYPGTVWLSK